MKKDVIQPELKGLIENLKRWFIVNKGNVCFVGTFVSFKKDKNEKIVINDDASEMIIYGDKHTLRAILEELRNIIEDEADKDGIVSI